MHNIFRRIAVIGLAPLFFSCGPKSDFTNGPSSSAVPSTSGFHPTAGELTLPEFPYTNSFEAVTDLAASGITSTFNPIKITTTEVHSGNQAIEAAGSLGGEGHPELHVQFILRGFMGTDSIDLSDKSVGVYIFIPVDSPIGAIGFTAFNSDQFVAIGHQNIARGQWNEVSFNVKAVYENQSWDYIPDNVTSDRAKEIIRNSEMFEVNGTRNDGSGPTSTHFTLDDLAIRASNPFIPIDDSVDSLRKYADQRHLLVGSTITNPPGFGDSEYLQILVQEFNMMITSTGAWKNLQPDPGENGFNFIPDEQFVHFGIANHLTVRGPCLGWHVLLPDWLLRSAYQDLDGILTTYIKTVMNHYQGDIVIWDAFNEVINDAGDGFRNRDDVDNQIIPAPLDPRVGFLNLKNSVWVRGSDTILIKKAFRDARSACGNCTLILNEFGNEEMGANHGNVEYPMAKADFFYRFVKELKTEGVPIDGVGFQLHLDESKIVDVNLFLDNVDKNVKRYNELGLQVQFTELDVRIHTGTFDPSTKEGALFLEGKLNRQAEIYRGLMRIALRNKNVTAFMMLGLTDRYSPIADNNPGTGYAHIFDKDYKPKPAFFALLDELKNFTGN